MKAQEMTSDVQEEGSAGFNRRVKPWSRGQQGVNLRKADWTSID
jgi:hypothetical protein